MKPSTGSLSSSDGCDFALQGSFSLLVYSVNGRLLSRVVLEEEVTALHLVSDYVILGTLQGNLQIRHLSR